MEGKWATGMKPGKPRVFYVTELRCRRAAPVFERLLFTVGSRVGAVDRTLSCAGGAAALGWVS